MTKHLNRWPLTFLFLLLLGCQQSINLEAPPEIIYGQDVCDECRMIINEARFAASYVTTDGTVRRFDDIGGMLAHDQKKNEAVHIYWVHDFNTEAWLKADNAYFVLSDDLHTPMGWGVAAFAQQTDAEAYLADREGIVTTYAKLQENIQSGTLDITNMVEHHDHENHNQ